MDVNVLFFMTIISVVFLVAGCSNLNSSPPAHINGRFGLSGTPLYSSTIKSRAITAENQRGAPGEGGKELEGRKGLPCLWNLKKDMTYTFAEMEGPGMVRHIWITVQNTSPQKMRNLILRFYWDGQAVPSVEAPLADFFGVCHGRTAPFESAYLSMPEGRGFNCFVPMPFKRKAKLTICNETGEDARMFFYQVDYTVGDPVSDDTPYFHAQFRRDLQTTMREDYVILDGVKGKGRFVGANLGLIDKFADKNVWWGEGEVKMYLDGDGKYPTICGTGTEDYVGSGWGLGQFHDQYMGAPLITDKYKSYYRFHAKDPIYFSQAIKVTIQQIGNDGKREPADPDGPLKECIEKGFYKKDHPGGNFERVDDVCSTAYWYQTLPTQAFPAFPDKELRSEGL
jgi:hypothetical protein